MSTNEFRLSTREAAEYIGVQPQTLAMWRSQKRYEIPFIKIGSLVRYRKSDLDAWLESRPRVVSIRRNRIAEPA